MSMGHNVLSKIVNAVRQGLDLTGLTAALDHGAQGIAADTIAESTSGSGVTVDGVVLKDGGVTSSGVTVKTGGDKTLAIDIANADYTVLAANSGKIHLVANVSADRTFTLPSAAAGLHYEFRSTMESADGHAWIIITGSDTNYYKGGVLWCKSDVAEGTASEVTIVAPNGSDDATIQINLPSVGTVVKMYCDGTNWFLTGFVMSVGTPAYT